MEQIKNCSEKTTIDLKILLLAGAKNYLGILNLPNESDLNIICNFIKNKFGEFTIAEIDNALQLYSEGTITTSVKPIGVLSTTFLSEVLWEYRSHRKAFISLQNRLKEKTLLIDKPNENSDEKNKRLTEWLLNWIKEKKQIPQTYAWDEVYFHLEKTNEINLSNEDKIDFMELTIEDIREKIEFYKSNPNKKDEVNDWMRTIQDKNLLQKTCRKNLVQLYLNKLVNQQNQQTNGND